MATYSTELLSPEIIANLTRKYDEFGFEMRIGHELRSHLDAQVRHGESYIEHDTGVDRQFDFQWVLANQWRRLQMAVECKNIFPDSPLVVCGHMRTPAESFHDLVFSGYGVLKGKNSRNAVTTHHVSEVFHFGPESNLYPATEPGQSFVGRSVFRPKPPSISDYTVVRDDEDLGRSSRALSSAADMALRSLVLGRETESTTFVLTVTLPMMVVPDGTLWTVELDQNGEVLGAPAQTDHVTLFRDLHVRLTEKRGTPLYRSVRLSHLHFVTATGLHEWLKKVTPPNSSFWQATFPEWIGTEFNNRFTAW